MTTATIILAYLSVGLAVLAAALTVATREQPPVFRGASAGGVVVACTGLVVLWPVVLAMAATRRDRGRP